MQLIHVDISNTYTTSWQGFMEYSYMFYGYYNNTVGVVKGFPYNISLAYLLTSSFYLIFCLTCIIIRSVMGGGVGF